MKSLDRSFWIWTFLFLIINICFPQVLSTNPYSRIAAMSAFCDHLGEAKIDFRINGYEGSTVDWARTPDGSYYSNKAPGPIILGAPMFCVMDKIFSRERTPHIYYYHFIVCFFLQMLPLIVAAAFLYPKINTSAPSLFLLLFYFGTTAALFMNTFFGHAHTAALLGLTLAALVYRNWLCFSFFFLLALLGDYMLLSALPVFIVTFAFCGYLKKWQAQQWLRNLFKLFLGSLIPVVMWIYYHQHSFGGIFSLPQKFQNPAFLDLKYEKHNLWGVFSILPNMKVFLKLIFGFERGLLWTQAWLCFVPIITWKNKEHRVEWIFIVGIFISFLFLNASFGQWHGGASTGPRYLSPILPLMSVLLVNSWKELNSIWKKFFLVTILYSLIFFAFAFSTSIVIGQEALWPAFFKIISEHAGTFCLRFFSLCILFAFAIRLSFSVNSKSAVQNA